VIFTILCRKALNISILRLTLNYSPVIAPHKNAKLSKRFQMCNDDEGIGKKGNSAELFHCYTYNYNDGTQRQTHFPKDRRENPEGAFQTEMKQGAMLADYLGVWMLRIDLKYADAPKCQKIETRGNCELEVITNFMCGIPDSWGQDIWG
jgi:hypothetical protein